MKQLLSDALLSYNVLRNERRRFVICFEIRDPLSLFYFAFLSQAAEKEAQLKEDKKQQRRERRKVSKQSDVGGAKQSRNQSANQPGNQPSKRKRPQTSHVFFEDSDGDENSETKTAKRRKGDHFTADADVCLRLLILRLVAPATSLLASYVCVCSMQMSLQ